ncbi:MAG: DNA repair protein RadC [Candidatus Omnitrophica bacterium]|nr:DNA repair protein RadC [Candidatus Omnitrophota bacterium]
MTVRTAPVKWRGKPRANLTIRELPVSERPRERLTALGPEAVSDQELLCCLLGKGIAGESVLVTAQRLLAAFGDLPGLAEASVEQLAQVRGVGPAKAVQVKAAVALARRLIASWDQDAPRRPVETAEDAATILRPALLQKQQEHFVILLLDNRRRLIRLSPIAVGSLSASLVHPRELFKEAIAASAAAVILAHNHPSGDPHPSEQDLTLTKRLVQAGKLLGIEVVDHLILGREGTVSLKALGVVS